MKKQSQSVTFRHCHVGWLAGVLVFFVAFICSSDATANANANAPEAPVATQLAAAPEKLKVDAARFTEQSFDWFDSQRQRKVPAKLYLPADKRIAGSVPLVVFSHGIGGSRDGYSYLGHYFAKVYPRLDNEQACLHNYEVQQHHQKPKLHNLASQEPYRRRAGYPPHTLEYPSQTYGHEDLP